MISIKRIDDDEAYNTFEIIQNGDTMELTVDEAAQVAEQLSQLLQDIEITASSN